MFSLATGAILIAMLLIVGRAIAGPSSYDRALAGNSFGTNVVLLIAVVGFLTDRPEFLDIAIVYALVNFIGTIAILRYRRDGSFADADVAPQNDDGSDKTAPGRPR